jgi:hypothetical protein
MSVRVAFLVLFVSAHMLHAAHGLKQRSSSKDSGSTLSDMGSILQDTPVELAPDMEKIGGLNLTLVRCMHVLESTWLFRCVFGCSAGSRTHPGTEECIPDRTFGSCVRCLHLKNAGRLP